MKKILIPTDFSEESILLLKKIKQQYGNNYTVLFTHLFYLPDGIQDLLFGTYRLREYKFVTDEFREAFYECMSIPPEEKNKPQVPIRFFYGNTLIFFKNFLSANAVDLIAYSENTPVKKLNSSSIPLLKVIKKCGVELLNADTIELNQPKLN